MLETLKVTSEIKKVDKKPKTKTQKTTKQNKTKQRSQECNRKKKTIPSQLQKSNASLNKAFGGSLLGFAEAQDFQETPLLGQTGACLNFPASRSTVLSYTQFQLQGKKSLQKDVGNNRRISWFSWTITWALSCHEGLEGKEISSGCLNRKRNRSVLCQIGSQKKSPWDRRGQTPQKINGTISSSLIVLIALLTA